MEDLERKIGDKEILYSKAIKAGKRIYYLDVKRNLQDDLFIAITESKKIQQREGAAVTFEKHKLFLYKEDFDKFMDGMDDVIGYIKRVNAGENLRRHDSLGQEDSEAIKLDIDF